MNERDELINRLTYLIKEHKIKLKRFQEENNLSEEVGCITREACEIMSWLPRMRRLNVSFDDCVTDPLYKGIK